MGLRVGWGELTYEVIPSWGRLPQGMEMGPVAAVAVDSRQRLYVGRRSDPSILILDAEGAVIGALGEGRVTDPHGICIGRDDSVYVADRDRHEVVVFDSTGKLTTSFGVRDQASPEAPFNHPCGMTVSEDGTLFVADGYGNSRIHVFGADRGHLRSWGAHGPASGEFMVPHGIAIDSGGRLYVADRENDRIEVFDSLGNLLDVWGGFRGPTDVCVDSEQRIYVTDHVPRLTVLNAGGTVLLRVRSLYDTHGVCCDSKGNVFIASTAGRSVIKYARVA